jgi:hypothetical protein
MARTFSALISDIAHGEIDDLATKAIDEVVTALQTGASNVGGKQKGQITVKLSFSMERGIIDTAAEVTTKMPPKVKPRAFLYPMRGGGLSEENQRQAAFDFGNARDVSTPAADQKVRDITDGRTRAANDK